MVEEEEGGVMSSILIRIDCPKRKCSGSVELEVDDSSDPIPGMCPMLS